MRYWFFYIYTSQNLFILRSYVYSAKPHPTFNVETLVHVRTETTVVRRVYVESVSLT